MGALARNETAGAVGAEGIAGWRDLIPGQEN
jgi:hypothetical protein